MSARWKKLGVLLMTTVLSSGLYAGGNMFKNGDFETENAKKPGTPAHWGINKAKGSSWETEGTNKHLRLACVKPGEMVLVYREFMLKPQDAGKKMKMTFKMRCNGIEKGEKAWFVGTLFMQFNDAAGKKLEGVKGIPRMTGTHAEWEDKTLEFTVPQGAQKFAVMPVLFRVNAGTLEFDDFTLAYVD
jgi:hypothetical protein